MNGNSVSGVAVCIGLGALLALAAAGCGGKEEKPEAEAKTAAPTPAPTPAAPTKSEWQPGTNGCLRLGWSGGAAGTGYKYVDANIVTETNELVMFQYEQKDGSMKGQKSAPGELTGTWSQKGASGTFYLKYDVATDAATGWWRTNGAENRNIMTLDKKCKL